MAPPTSNQLSMNNHYLSCSAIGQHRSGPCSQVTVSEEPLGKWLRKRSLVWWSSGGAWSKRQIQGLSWRSSSSPSLGPAGELEGPGDRLGATPRGLQGLHRPSTTHGPGLEERWTSPPSLSLWPNSSGRLPDLWDLVSPFGPPEEAQDQLGWVPGSLRDDSWEECGSLALKELPTEIRLLLARTGTLEGGSCALVSCPFWSGQRITFIW